MADEEKDELSFEEAIEQLEGIVEKLEEGEVPLEKAISMYQEGMTLSSYCHKKLQVVEKQMDEIIDENGTVSPLKLEEEE